MLPGLLAGALLTACGSPPPAKQPPYLRSPSQDYPAPLESASDGEVVGAHGQAPEDTLAGGATNERPGPGWELDHGKLKYNRERAVGGHGHQKGDDECEPAEGRPKSATPNEDEPAKPLLARAVDDDKPWPRCKR